VNVRHRDIYYAKNILNFFFCIELKILEKSEICMKLTFSEAITTNMQIGNDWFVFKYPVMCKQKISKFTLFFLKLK